MKSGHTRFWTSLLTGLLSIFLFAFLVILLGDWKTRADLTEDQRYTLPEAAERIAGRLEDDFIIDVYLSENLPSYLRFLPSVLRTRLQEFREASDGKLSYRFIDPDEWAEDDERREDLAARGIVPTQAADRVEGKVTQGAYYLFLEFRYLDRTESLNLATLGREVLTSEAAVLQLLPFHVASRIVKLVESDIKVGIASKKFTQPPQQQGQQPQQTDGLIAFRQNLETHVPSVVDVDLANGAPVPEGLTCLIVHRPERYDETAVRNLEAYLLKGGRIVILLDNFSTMDMERQFDLQNAMRPQSQGMLKVRDLDLGALGPWLEAHGIVAKEGYLESVSGAKDSMTIPRLVQLPNGQQSLRTEQVVREVPHVLVVPESDEEGNPAGWFDDESPVLAGLGRAGMMTAVPLELRDEAPALLDGVKRDVLLRSTDDTYVRELQQGKIKMLQKEGEGTVPPKSEWRSWPLILSLRGQFKAVAPKDEDATGEDGEGEDQTSAHPSRSTADGQLWVVADSDFASNLGLSFAQRILQSASVYRILATTQAGIVNLVDTITVGEELVEMRRPMIQDRSLDAAQVEEEADRIRLLTVGLPPALLVAFGLLVWIGRAISTHVPSPTPRNAEPLRTGREPEKDKASNPENPS